MDQLESFLDSLYGELAGYVCVAIKQPDTESAPEKHFFEWPMKREDVGNFVRSMSDTHDVWVSPCLWRNESLSVDSFKGTRWIWAEFNTLPDQSMDFFPRMGMKIESSTGRTHAYWRLPGFENDPAKVERFNQRLAFNFLSNFASVTIDTILRVPGTINHRTLNKVSLVDADSGSIELMSLFTLKEPGVEHFQKVDTSKSVPGYVFTQKLREGKTAKLIFEGSGSNVLMEIAIGCLRSELFDNEVYSALKLANKRVKIIQPNRDDIDKQLIGIIGMARRAGNIRSENQRLFNHVYGIMDLVQMERKLEWVIPDVLGTKSTAMVFARPNVGKSRLSIQAAISIALGEELIGFKVKKPRPSLFISAEMNDEEFQQMAIKMTAQYDRERQEFLNRNLFVHASNHGFSFEDPKGFEDLVKLIERYEPGGIFFDSLFAIGGDPTQLGFMNDLFGQIREIQAEYNLFTWWVHHPRKQSGQDHKPKNMDDIYGARPVTSAPTLIMGMWQDQPNSELPVEFTCIKNRSAPYFQPRSIATTNFLTFEESKGVKDASIEEQISVFANLDRANSEPRRVGTPIPSQQPQREKGKIGDGGYSF